MSARVRMGLAAVLLLVLANLWRYGAFQRRSQAVTVPALPSSLAAPAPVGPRADLFNFQAPSRPSSRPVPTKVKPAPEPPMPQPTPVPTSAWSALGLIRRQGRLLALLQHSDGHTETVREGQALEDGWSVEAVQEDGVKLRRTDGSRVLLPLRGAP